MHAYLIAGGFSTAGIKQEEVVNLGLKSLVLEAFVGAASVAS